MRHGPQLLALLFQAAVHIDQAVLILIERLTDLFGLGDWQDPRQVVQHQATGTAFQTVDMRRDRTQGAHDKKHQRGKQQQREDPQDDAEIGNGAGQKSRYRFAHRVLTHRELRGGLQLGPGNRGLARRGKADRLRIDVPVHAVLTQLLQQADAHPDISAWPRLCLAGNCRYRAKHQQRRLGGRVIDIGRGERHPDLARQLVDIELGQRDAVTIVNLGIRHVVWQHTVIEHPVAAPIGVVPGYVQLLADFLPLGESIGHLFRLAQHAFHDQPQLVPCRRMSGGLHVGVHTLKLPVGEQSVCNERHHHQGDHDQRVAADGKSTPRISHGCPL